MKAGKVKDIIRNLSPKNGDIIVINNNEFPKDEDKKYLMEKIGPLLHSKHIGIMFVNNVHDDIAIKKDLMNWIEEQKGLIYEKERTVSTISEATAEIEKGI